MDILKKTSSTRENLGLLAVMDALEGQQDPEKRITQRELAQVTGLNLKKVNYCLHRLLERGYVKFQRARQSPDKRVYLYILTPAGLKAKSQLTYRFLKLTLDFYNKVEEKLQQCLNDMAEERVERVVLYGASDIARVLLGMVNGSGIRVVCVVDEAYKGREFHGVPVIDGQQLKDLLWDRVLITALEDEKAEEGLRALSVAQESIWRLS